ncbi:MAG: PEP-CTERM sorting domain-containing protein [Planctomycetota bacterium]
MKGTLSWLPIGATLAVAAQAFAIDYDEGVDGDLSGDPLAPFVLGPLDEGSNIITTSATFGDVDYITVTIPTGFELSSLVLDDYIGLDTVAFIAVQEGTIFTTGPDGPDVFALLGWTLFGPTAEPVGTDLLPIMADPPAGIGFDGTLGEGDYTFWVQQTGDLTTHTFDFTVTAVIPAPATLGMFALAGLGRRRRRR